MKILHITPAYVPSYKHGGPIKSVHYLNKYLVRHGVDVTVYTTTINGGENLSVPLETPVMIDGVRVFYFKPSFPRAWSYSSGMRKMIVKTAGQFDLIHITSVFLAASTLGARYAKKFKKPYIVSPRGSLMREPLAMKSQLKKRFYISLIEKRNLRDASAIHFTSEAEREEYVRAGLELRHGIVIPNSFDPEDFERETSGTPKIAMDFPQSAKIVLYLGRLNWKKGIDTLIPAFKEVVKVIPGAILVMAGGDESGYKKTIDKMIEENGVSKNVRFTGIVLGADKLAILKRSDVFVLPSYSENFGMAVIEAMYSKIPVVITKGVGISPEIERVDAGIVVEKTVDAVSWAIIRVLNGSIAKDLGARGKEFVELRFGADKIAELMALAYESAVQKNKI